jgi:hypothetical protein
VNIRYNWLSIGIFFCTCTAFSDDAESTAETISEIASDRSTAEAHEEIQDTEATSEDTESIIPEPADDTNGIDTEVVPLDNADEYSKPFLLDAIRAIVITAGGTELVTQSDLERPNFFGKIPTLEEEVEERLVYQDALKHHVVNTDEQIDRQIAVVMRQNNLTLDELKAVCSNYGMTFQELRDKLSRAYSVSSIREHAIESRLIINRSEVVAYYEAHPEMSEVVYNLQRAIVPYEDDRDTQRTAFLDGTLSKETLDNYAWGVTFAIEHSAVAEEKAFIHTMQAGDIVLADERHDGFELYRLVDKKGASPRTLDERYLEIDEILRRPLREQLLLEYRQKLFDAATIVYL